MLTSKEKIICPKCGKIALSVSYNVKSLYGGDIYRHEPVFVGGFPFSNPCLIYKETQNANT